MKVVSFLVPHSPYNAGETAGFADADADALVAAGTAAATAITPVVVTSNAHPALVNAANDATANTDGVSVEGVYRNGSVLMQRVT